MQDGQIKKKKKNQLSWDVINWVDNTKLFCYTLRPTQYSSQGAIELALVNFTCNIESCLYTSQLLLCIFTQYLHERSPCHIKQTCLTLHSPVFKEKNVLCWLSILRSANVVNKLVYLFLTIVHFHKAMVDEEYCDCQVPCSQIKYHPEVSYSKFPDASTADSLIKSGYYADIQYQR